MQGFLFFDRSGGPKRRAGVVLLVHWVIAGLDRGRLHWTDAVPASRGSGAVPKIASVSTRTSKNFAMSHSAAPGPGLSISATCWLR
jgi:hypothetical protein